VRKRTTIPSISYKNLPRGIYGYWVAPAKKDIHYPGKIQIAKGLSSKRLLETLIHELLHEYFPDITEEKVTIVAVAIGQALWDHKFREIPEL